MRAGNFLPALELRMIAPAGAPCGRRATGRSVCARRRPSPTSASRLFLVPGSQGPLVPGETRRRSPTPAGAARYHAPAAVAPERTA